MILHVFAWGDPTLIPGVVLSCSNTSLIKERPHKPRAWWLSMLTSFLWRFPAPGSQGWSCMRMPHPSDLHHGFWRSKFLHLGDKDYFPSPQMFLYGYWSMVRHYTFHIFKKKKTQLLTRYVECIHHLETIYRMLLDSFFYLVFNTLLFYILIDFNWRFRGTPGLYI